MPSTARLETRSTSDHLRWPQALRLKHLAFNFKKHRFEVFFFPATWADRDGLQALRQRLLGIARQTHDGDPDYGFFAKMEHWQGKIVTICTRNGRDIGFNSMCVIGSYRGKRVLHLGSVYVTDGGKGIMQLIYSLGIFFFFFFNRCSDFYVTSLTHTPRILGSVAEYFHQVYPNPLTGQPLTAEHCDLRDIFLGTYVNELNLPEQPVVNDEFVIERMRMRADKTVIFDTSSSTVPKHRKDEFNHFCDTHIDYARGDEVLQVGSFRRAEFFNGLRVFLRPRPS